jgi:P4 family phage/plasmid primase-like protien
VNTDELKAENPEVAKKIDKMLSEEEYLNLSASVMEFLLKKDRAHATEIIVKEVLKRHHIYTTRSDVCPEMWIYFEGIYIPEGKSFVKDLCRKFLGETYSFGLANDVIAKIETDTFIDSASFFNKDLPNELAVENGVLNIFTKELQPFNPEKIFFNKLPVKYDKTADCPNIKKHFESVLKDTSDVPVIQEMLGDMLQKEYRFEKAFMLLGGGRNGKGKSLDLIKRFLGADNCCGISLQSLEQDEFASSILFKKMANLCGDLDSRSLLHTGIFKQLTGRDLISANRKNKPRINYVNFAKLVFCANQLPQTKDITVAFFNRWILLDFPYTFVDKEEHEETKEEERQTLKIRDADIVAKLTTPEELSGMLNWALEGLERLNKNKRFSFGLSTKEVMDSWLRKSDSFWAFCKDCIEQGEDVDFVTKTDLKRAYQKYCKKYKLFPTGEYKMREFMFNNFAVSEGKEYVDGKQVRTWDGIRLKDTSMSIFPIVETHHHCTPKDSSLCIVEEEIITTQPVVCPIHNLLCIFSTTPQSYFDLEQAWAKSLGREATEEDYTNFYKAVQHHKSSGEIYEPKPSFYALFKGREEKQDGKILERTN